MTSLWPWRRKNLTRTALFASFLVLLKVYLFVTDATLLNLHHILQIDHTLIRHTPCQGHEFTQISNGTWYGPSYGRKANVADPVVFVTAKFGPNEIFRDSLIWHASCAWRSGPFDLADMYVYSAFPDWITDDHRWNRHIQFYSNPDVDDETRLRGGFWFWKPVLLAHHLRDLPDGSWSVYADADRIGFVEYLADLMEHMQADGADLAVEQHVGCCQEHLFTKGDVYAYLGLTQEHMEKDVEGQYHANFFVIRKTPATLKFFSMCEKVVENYHLVSNEKSRDFAVKNEYFVRHGNDQSIMSQMMKHKFSEPRKKFYRQVQSRTAGPFKGLISNVYTFDMMASNWMKKRK